MKTTFETSSNLRIWVGEGSHPCTGVQEALEEISAVIELDQMAGRQIAPGTMSAIAEIYRQCETRLAAAIKPGALTPVENQTARNGRAASAAVIAEIRQQMSSFCAR